MIGCWVLHGLQSSSGCDTANGGVAPDYTEARGQQVMDRDEITIRIGLGRGDAAETVWTSDLSHDYVTINAEYRT